MAYRVGSGSVCQAGLQTVWGTPVSPDKLINITGESIKVTVVGLRAVTVNFSIPYSDAMDTFKKTYYLGQSSPSVALKLKFTTSDVDENIEIYIPYVNITSADGNVGGSGIIDSSFSGEALSVGNTEPVTITVNHNSQGDN